MNIRSEVRLELIRDNLSFSFCIPSNTIHDVAIDVLKEMILCVEDMQKRAEEQKKAAEASAQSDTSAN